MTTVVPLGGRLRDFYQLKLGEVFQFRGEMGDHDSDINVYIKTSNDTAIRHAGNGDWDPVTQIDDYAKVAVIDSSLMLGKEADI